MKSSRPYLVRALHEWIIDNGCTPYLLVDAMARGVDVPQQYVKNGQIVLNISPTAVGGVTMGNEEIRFRGRFGGVAIDILVPVAAVLGIYARENGQGMVFDPEPPDAPEPPEPPGIDDPTRAGKPSLRVVK
ncbi:MAG TPA: ClpXP protease specificity-enhancing factor [Pseudomonadales bacterium]|nr:ClpXP protease specificity-enhancing factor [Pseudomonadales bacterium]HND13739.1 ClpXP protease specificity-enhancing factor [Pseudomonadales bacterium]